MEEGKNILKLDGPISSKTFLKSAAIIFGYSFFACMVVSLLHFAFEITKYSFIFFIVVWTAIIILLAYTSWINFTKRIWDILGNKGNAIFYSLALLIANIAMGLIPIVCYLTFVLSIVVLGFLLFKKGKLVETQTKNNDEVA